MRERAGLFDVSHMGQLHLRGPGAVAAVEWLVSCPRRLAAARARALRLPLQRGAAAWWTTSRCIGSRDDALFLCVNAANIEKDYRWVVRHTPGRRRGARTAAPRPRCSRSRGRRARRCSRPCCDAAARRRCPASRSPARSSRGARGAGLAHRLHGQRRLRALLRARRRARALGRAARRGRRARPRAGRARRARHAAPRGGAPALRPRARRRDLAARGAPRPLREAGRRRPSSAARRSRGAARRAIRKLLVGFELARARRRPRRLRARARRARGRRRHLGRALSHPRKIDRARLRSARPRRAGHASRGDGARPRGGRAGGRDAVRSRAGAGFAAR